MTYATEWYGELPSDWPCRRISHLGRVTLGKMVESLPEGCVGQPYMRAANVQPDGVLALDDVKRMPFTADEAARLTLRKGDVVIVEGGVGGYGRSAFVDRDLDGWGFQNSIVRVRPSSGTVGRFVAYCLLHLRAVGYISITASTASMPHFTAEKVAATRVPTPPREEQAQIADFLDYETGKIDAFIADQERLIDLLTERRRSMIAQVLRSTAPSGKSVMLKHTGVIVLGKMLQTTSRDGDGMQPYLRAANVQPDGVLDLGDVKRMPFSRSETARLDLRRGDVVVVEGGVGGYGRAAVLSENLGGWGFQNSIVRIRPAEGYDGRFLAYALLELRASGYITMVASVTSMPHFTAEKVAVTRVPHATPQEQKRAADHLDLVVAEVDAAIADAREAIALSKERRAALISAAVTGKIDVRDWKRPEHRAS